MKEFFNFLEELPIQDTFKSKDFYLNKLTLILDYEQTGEINSDDFIKSYNSYLNYEEILRDLYMN